MKNLDTSSQNKRIVFVTGDKGGVGKSFTSRAIVQYYLDLKQPFRGFDIDPVNPNLEQFYPDFRVIAGTVMTGPWKSLFSRSSYFASPAAKLSRQR